MTGTAAKPESAAEAWLLREVYAAHQIFMNFGYQAGEIFIGRARSYGELLTGEQARGQLCLFVQLKCDERTFTVLIAAITKAEGERFLDAWNEFAVNGKRAASIAELDAMLYGSVVFQRRADLLYGLEAKGFRLVSFTDLS